MLTGSGRGPTDERGQLLLGLAALLTGMALSGLVIGQVALAASVRSSVQAAADGAALAAAHALALQVEGTDTQRWDCAGATTAPLRAAASDIAARNGANVASLRREDCDVVVALTADRRLPTIGIADAGVRAWARASVRPGTRPGAGTGAGSLVAVPASPRVRGTLLAALVAEADRIDRMHLPYVWGGGHQSSPAPADGPFDCSGAVSRVLQSIGYPIPTLVSRDFMRIGAPGPGRVTIWAYDGHVFMTIDGRGWGTGSRPRGGAGWLPYATPYHGRFVARHLPELDDDTIVDLSTLDLGSVWLGGGVGTPPEVVLAPLGG